jgi:putative pyruvate formate lyase activating enzyme
MSDFDDLWVWQDPALERRLAWYRAVAENRKPAKFRIAATIPLAVPLRDSPEEALWGELDRLTPIFLARLDGIRRQDESLDVAADGDSLLELCAELANRMLTHCNFCRWDCRVDRAVATKVGACKLGSDARVGTYFHHRGEELVYRGTEGSGTIFFTSCNMRCAFCQNGDISTDKDNGEVTDSRTLATMAWLLRMEGCHNINWVGGDPTIHLHRIVEAIRFLGRGFTPDHADTRRARATKADRIAWYDIAPENGTFAGSFNAPLLWNSNFFMSAETMKILRLLIDVWLPDFKFGPGRCAMALSKTTWYWETVTANHQTLDDWGEDFTIRHLVMPNHVECCTYAVFDWIAEHMPDAPVNVMDQYHPDNFCDPESAKYRPQYEELSRRLAFREFEQACGYARKRKLNFETITFEKRALASWA